MKNNLRLQIVPLIPWQKSALVVKGSDWKYYLPHKEENTLNLSDKINLKTWMIQNWFDEDDIFEVLPHWISVTDVTLWSTLWVSRNITFVVRMAEAIIGQVSFIEGDLKGNFEKLRIFHWLKKDDHISSILKSYTLTFEDGRSVRYDIPDSDSSKPGILLLTLAAGRDEFELNNNDRALVHRYFWYDICEWLEQWTDKKYTPIAHVLIMAKVKIKLQKSD